MSSSTRSASPVWTDVFLSLQEQCAKSLQDARARDASVADDAVSAVLRKHRDTLFRFIRRAAGDKRLDNAEFLELSELVFGEIKLTEGVVRWTQEVKSDG